jgi:exopolyphosphatase/guanosine-5'-triphosphate,3'-diphosphate pyrophosphatase
LRIAAIDIGTNSTRLLVADVDDGRIDELFRRSIVTRLGDRVDQTGRLDDAAQARVIAALSGYRDELTAAGATRVVGVATSAVRDAANGDEFRARIAAELGIEIAVIEGDEEARLTFAGANTAGEVGGAGRAVVVDIGGGSTEFIVGHEGELEFHVSTDVGAVRQSERHLHTDPPTAPQLQALIDEVEAIIESEVPARFRENVVQGIGVAGTPTVLASVDQALDPFDPWKVHGYEITREAARQLLAARSPVCTPTAHRQSSPARRSCSRRWRRSRCRRSRSASTTSSTGSRCAPRATERQPPPSRYARLALRG